MKKQKLKNYLKKGILLLGISLILTNCSKDESIELNKNSNIKKSFISLNKFYNKDNVFNTIKKITTIQEKDDLSLRTIHDSINGIYINTNDAILLETEEYHWLTFYITREQQTSTLENLVLKYDLESNTYKTFIASYNLTETELQTIEDGNTVSNLIEKMELNPLDNFNTNIFNRGNPIKQNPITGDCYFLDPACTCEGEPIFIEIGIPCPGNIGGNSSSSDTNNNSSSNSDDGNESSNNNNSDSNQNNGNNNSNDNGSGTNAGTNYGENQGSDYDSLPDDYNDAIVTVPIKKDGLTRECEKISNLLNENPEYKTKLLQLAADAPNATFEKGIAINKNGNDINIPDGIGGALPGIPPNPSKKYLSIAHIHDVQGLDGNGTYSVPSLGDLGNLGFISVINNKVKLNKLVYFLFTADGTYYALTINNPYKFRTFWAYQKFLHDNVSLTDEEKNEYQQILKDRAQENNNGIYFIEVSI